VVVGSLDSSIRTMSCTSTSVMRGVSVVLSRIGCLVSIRGIGVTDGGWQVDTTADEIRKSKGMVAPFIEPEDWFDDGGACFPVGIPKYVSYSAEDDHRSYGDCDASR